MVWKSNWTCPHCSRVTTINKDDRVETTLLQHLQSKDGQRRLHIRWIICPSTLCNKLSLYVTMFYTKNTPSGWQDGEILRQWTLIPDTKAKIFPGYIPEPLLEDYGEAYSIMELSPKSAATLARRCIQGMIRDFWGIKKSRLIDEIDALKGKIDPLVWDSIDAVRKVGNIGAHMEKDINVIVDVEPKEAELLIQLVEMLFVEWYVHRENRKGKLNKIVELAKNKEEIRKESNK